MIRCKIDRQEGEEYAAAFIRKFEQEAKTGWTDKIVAGLDPVEAKRTGAIAEIAISQRLGLPVLGTNGKKKGDILGGIEVRGTRNKNGQLRTYINDFAERPLLLGVVIDNETVDWMGWLFVWEARQVGWFRNRPGYRRHWAVSQGWLRDPLTLLRWIEVRLPPEQYPRLTRPQELPEWEPPYLRTPGTALGSHPS